MFGKPHAVLLILLGLLTTTPAYAIGLAFSEAQLNWSGLTYTISGGLTVARNDNAVNLSGSYASTSLGGSSNQQQETNSHPLDWSYTTAASAYANPGGVAAAGASSAAGMLTSYSVAGTTPESNYIINSGRSGSFTDSDFWLYGSGVGTLTVSVPYSLQINLSETAPRLPEQGPYDATAATAVARLVMGPGVLEGGYQAETLSWSESDPALNGVLTRSGVLSVSKGFNNPYWGPLTSIFADVSTSATARIVPEPSSFLLLVLGLVVLTVRWWKWRGSALV